MSVDRIDNYVIVGPIKPNLLVLLLGSDYIIIVAYTMPSTRVRVIASTAHLLVVERYCCIRVLQTVFAAN